MRNAHLSGWISDLARECGLSAGAQVAGDAYREFAVEYEKLAARRDTALSNHLRKTPGLFRCEIADSPRRFGVAAQVLWYADEILVRDPLAFVSSRLDLDRAETWVWRVDLALQAISGLESAMERGLVLLAGDDILPARSGPVPSEALFLARKPEVVTALDSAIRLGLQVQHHPIGQDIPVWGAYLDWGGMVPMTIPKGSAVSTWIDTRQELPPATLQEVRDMCGLDPLPQVRATLYPGEVAGTLHAALRAVRNNSSVLFDRAVAETVLSHASFIPAVHNHGGPTVPGLDLLLPYVDGLPPSLLLEIRDAETASFTELRRLITGIVLDDDPGSALTAAARLQLELEKHKSQFLADLDALTKKTRVTGYGGPAMLMTGALTGTILGLPLVPTVVAAASTAAVAAVSSFAESLAQRSKLAVSPWRFLWKAGRIPESLRLHSRES